MAPTRMKLRVRRREGGVTPGEREAEAGEGGVQGGGGGGGGGGKKPPSPAAPSGDEEASPDSKCPICLDRFNNLAYLDRCLHRFCFPCIQEWSHNKAECPLCKQAFTSILHSVRSHDDFKEYTLRPPPPPSNASLAATVAMVTAFATAAAAAAAASATSTGAGGGGGGGEEEEPQRRRRRRRLGGEVESGSGGGARRRERGGRGSRARERRAEEEEPGVLPAAPPPLPSLAPYSPGSPPPRGREEPGDRGVLFEGLSGLGGAAGVVLPGDRSARRLMARLAARQREQQRGGAPRRLREREMLAFRRALYRTGAWAPPGHPGQPQQDVSAEGFVRTPGQLTRLRPWLRRELTVLYGAHGSLVDVVQRVITARITRHGLERTRCLEDELRPFLLARTQHFLHELSSFARSALGMDRYDAQTVYEPPAAAAPGPASPADRLSSSAHSSVIAISEGEERPENLSLSLATWDEDTPGPSYSTAQTAPAATPSPAPPSPGASEGAGHGGGEEECLIVGYVKPMAERTPELVQLSSDTEEEAEEAQPQPQPQQQKPKEEEQVLPPLPTLLPCRPEPPSSSSAERPAQASSPSPLAPPPWSCSSDSPRPQEGGAGLLPNSPDGGEGGRGGRRRKMKKKRRKRMTSGERDRCSLNSSVCSGLDLPRSRSSSSSLPRSPSSTDASPWECPASRRRATPPSSPPSSSPPCPPQRHSDKPGGKRKYKSRHLDEHGDPTWRPGSGHHGDAHKSRGGEGGGGGEGGEKRAQKRGRERGRRRERERRRDAHKHNSVCEDQSSSSSSSSSSSGGGRSGRRSPSVEIIYEGKLGPSAPPRNKRRRKRRHHRRPPQNGSPVVITIDSHSSPDEGGQGNRLPVFAQLGARQPADFSACVSELPVDILARGSDWSDTEPNHQSKASDVLAVDISDDDKEDEQREGDVPGAERNAEQEEGSDGDENILLATILDEITQLNPRRSGHDSPAQLLWPGTKTRRRGGEVQKVEEGGDLAALPLPPPPDLAHAPGIRPSHNEPLPHGWAHPPCDPGPFPETQASDGTRPLKWNHPLHEAPPPGNTCSLVWGPPVSPTRPFYKPRSLSDQRHPGWTHPQTLPSLLDLPRPSGWSLPLNETACKQETSAHQTLSVPVCSSHSPVLPPSSEAPPPAVTSPAVNGNDQTAKLRPDRESSASPLLSPAPSQDMTSDHGPGQGRLKLQLPVVPACVSGTDTRTHISD